MAIQNSTYHNGFIWDSHLEGGGGLRGSSIVPLERAIVVSYMLPILTTAVSLTIWPQFAIKCLQRSIPHGVGHFGGQNFMASLLE